MRRLFVLLVLPSLLLAPPGARGEIIEKVVAKVNGQIITLSEFQSRQIAAAQAARVDPATVATFLRQNNAKILQDAIDEILIMQKAEDAGMKAPSQWIDEAIAGIHKENNITSDEQMQDALDREGITLAELRTNIERGIVRRSVMEREIRPKIEATESELLAEYEKLKPTEFTKAPTVTLQEILVKEDAGGIVLARQIVEKARAGEDFAALATAYSAAPSRAHGGEVGQLSQGDMNPELEKVAFGLPVGSVSEPAARRGRLPDPEGDGQDLGQRHALRRRQGQGPRPAHGGPLREGVRRLHGRAPEGREHRAARARGAASADRAHPRGEPPRGPRPARPRGRAFRPGAGRPAAPGATDTIVIPTEKAPVAPPAADEEITTTPQAAPERVAPPPPPAAPTPKDPPPGP